LTESDAAGHAWGVTARLASKALPAEVGRPAASLGADTRPPLSFRDAYEQGFAFVWRNLRRLGVSPDRIDDAFQDVFVVVHRKLPEFEGRCSLRSWLFAIVERVSNDYRRSRRRKGALAAGAPGSVDADTLAASPAASPAERAEIAERVRLLYQILEQIDEAKRAILILAELEQMTAPEIADAVGIPLNTVYSRLRLARQAFDEALARHRARERSGTHD
jgi:RNA polymerase sigma-70 factor (ECF subfamily)